MDVRIFIAAAFGLVLVALGGFYFLLNPRSHELIEPPARTATQAPAAVAPSGSAAPPAAQTSPAQTPPARFTAATIEAEIGRSEHAELQALLKKHFSAEYNEIITVAVQRRNEGASEQAFGQELFGRFQDLMRAKLKFAAGASTTMIDGLAANEVGLFHALGTEGARFCLKILGKDETPADAPLPENVRRMMRLGTLYRFQAIVEGLSNQKPIEPLTAEEMATFEASLNRDGLKFDEVRSGAFLDKGGNEPGKPCLMVEKLYQSIARLGEGSRRKIYSGMFFLGRDK